MDKTTRADALAVLSQVIDLATGQPMGFGLRAGQRGTATGAAADLTRARPRCCAN